MFDASFKAVARVVEFVVFEDTRTSMMLRVAFKVLKVVEIVVLSFK